MRPCKAFNGAQVYRYMKGTGGTPSELQRMSRRHRFMSDNTHSALLDAQAGLSMCSLTIFFGTGSLANSVLSID